MYRKPELLIPASSLEVLKVAVMFGADAVYIGGEAFGLRAKAKNFPPEDMRQGVLFAHEHGVKVYVTANILAHNADLDGVRAYFKELKQMNIDAVIISDPAVFMIAKEELPETDIHISTQANNTNYGTFRFWYGLGAKRVVTARELSLEEIKEIRSEIPDDMEIETFIHGAMCISYSGRCLLSSFMAGRDANRGACTHPCRWKYAVMEESRPLRGTFHLPRGPFSTGNTVHCQNHVPLTVSVSSAAPEVRFRDNTSSKLRTSSSFVLSFISSFNNSYKTVIPMDVLRSFPSASRNFFLYPSNLSCSI